MSRWIFATIVTCAVIFLGFQTYVYAGKILQSSDTWGETERSIVNSNVKLSLNLYSHITDENTKDSILFSPFSISAALGMALLGSRGNTSQQIREAFLLDDGVSRDDVHGAFKYLLRELVTSNESKHALHVANKLFLHRDYHVLETFQGESTFFYDAKLVQLDFVMETESSRDFINRWVASVTHNKILDLLKTGVITPDTMLVLANAIYFKGLWLHQFDKLSTIKRPFFVSDSKTIMTDTMHQEGIFPMAFIPELDSHALSLPYVGGYLSMFIILPVDTMGVNEVENKLSSDHIQTMRNKLTNTELHIFLPKFKLTQKLDLVHTLLKLGITDLFTANSADLSGINGDRDLHVSDVLHTAFIDVTESGSEAAAATAANIALLSAGPIENIIFRVDHPFIFYIQDSKTGIILFQGRYMGERHDVHIEL